MKRIVRMLSLLLTVVACDSGVLSPTVPDEPQRVIDASHDMIVLGDKLEDPYTVENMTRAMESLYGATKASRVVLNTTDYYVRFLPESEEEYESLQKMGVSMIDHPVDYEIVREGDYYHDPEIDEGNITWQYAVVKKGFSFPSGIKYEILDDCYLADHVQGTKADWVDWDAVEREAFRLTGNEKLLVPETKADDESVSGVPEGRVTIKDDRSGEVVGVKGVKVSCNCFVKFANTFTDENGYYKMGRSFSSEVRYRLVFKNKTGFAIGFNLILVPASVTSFGKATAKGMDIDIDNTSDWKLFCRCAVNNAGYDYFNDCEERGMRKPPANLRLWLFQLLPWAASPMLQQGALIDNTLIGELLGEYAFLVKMFLPDITMGMKDCNDYADIYGMTIHEMAHASHFIQVGTEYWDDYIKNVVKSFVTSGFVMYGSGTEEGHGLCEIGEIWAYYVQTMFYREKYGDTAATFGTSYWFRPQILVNLDSKGLSREKILEALTSDIRNIEMLQKKLISLYPEMKNTINQAFGRYN